MKMPVSVQNQFSTLCEQILLTYKFGNMFDIPRTTHSYESNSTVRGIMNYDYNFHDENILTKFLVLL